MKFSWQLLERPIMVLAPMEDVTDSVFRRVVASAAPPDVYVTEFTSVNGLFSRGREEVMKRFDYTEAERPIIAQVWGTDPELFQKAAELIVGLKFDGMDVNMGCPEKNVTSRGAGACLIDDRQRVGEIIAAVKEGLKKRIPLSVKTRLGYKKIAPDWIPFLLGQNLDALIVHCRTAAELSKVPAHWDVIGEYTKLPRGKTVIIGNGDVQNYKEAVEKCNAYGVDGVMIGRGIFSNLWAFDKQEISHMGDHAKLVDMLREHLKLFEKTGKHFAIMKKFFKMYVQNFPRAGEVREHLMQATSRREAESILDHEIGS